MKVVKEPGRSREHSFIPQDRDFPDRQMDTVFMVVSDNLEDRLYGIVRRVAPLNRRDDEGSLH